MRQEIRTEKDLERLLKQYVGSSDVSRDLLYFFKNHNGDETDVWAYSKGKSTIVFLKPAHSVECLICLDVLPKVRKEKTITNAELSVITPYITNGGYLTAIYNYGHIRLFFNNNKELSESEIIELAKLGFKKYWYNSNYPNSHYAEL